MKIKIHHYFFLFIVFLFLGICSVNLFSDGMFLDGLFYADIARNMAEGLGSFWKPHLSDTMFNEFYEHPPLALGIQSICFRLFGDSLFVERFYSLFTYLIVGYLIVLIWTKLTNDKRNGWIPLFIWLIINDVSWAAANNLLENTMSIFVCLSVLFYLNSLGNKRIPWIILSGLALSLGLLTKGFFCLYIWSVPFFIWLFRRDQNFINMSVDTAILVSCTILPIGLLFFNIPDAQNNMTTYVNNQVIGSIQNVQTVNSRFAIVGKFFKNALLPLLIGAGIILTAFLKKTDKKVLFINLKQFLMFLSIVFSGILPIMISMKQRGFYILTVYPLFAIGFGIFLYPIIKPAAEKIKTNSKGFKLFKNVTYLIIITSLTLSVAQINRVGRDKTMIHDSKTVIHKVGENTTINICPSMYSIWNLHGYFSRYGNVSLDKDQANHCDYYLTFENCSKKVRDTSFFEPVPVKLEQYRLYRRKELMPSCSAKLATPD